MMNDVLACLHSSEVFAYFFVAVTGTTQTRKTRVNGGARCIEGKESEITTAEVEVVRGINMWIAKGVPARK